MELIGDHFEVKRNIIHQFLDIQEKKVFALPKFFLESFCVSDCLFNSFFVSFLIPSAGHEDDSDSDEKEVKSVETQIKEEEDADEDQASSRKDCLETGSG